MSTPSFQTPTLENSGVSADVFFSLQSVANVFNPDGNTTNIPARDAVHAALLGDERLVRDWQVNGSAIGKWIAGESDNGREIGMKFMDRVDGHKQRLGFGSR